MTVAALDNVACAVGGGRAHMLPWGELGPIVKTSVRYGARCSPLERRSSWCAVRGVAADAPPAFLVCHSRRRQMTSHARRPPGPTTVAPLGAMRAATSHSSPHGIEVGRSAASSPGRIRDVGLLAVQACAVASKAAAPSLHSRLQPRAWWTGRCCGTVCRGCCFEIDSMLATRCGMSGKSKETARDGLAVAVRAADPEEARWPTSGVGAPGMAVWLTMRERGPRPLSE